jgi:hypothetical protein
MYCNKWLFPTRLNKDDYRIEELSNSLFPFSSNVCKTKISVLVSPTQSWCLGTFPGRRATQTCASLLATGLFIDSQRLVGDGASLDLAMVEVRHLFQLSSWRHKSLAVAASFDESRKL